MINTSKPNSPQITWSDILTTWLSETRTWASLGESFTNSSRVISSMTNGVNYSSTGQLWSQFTTPWTLTSPWTTTGGFNNTSKP